VIINRRSVVLAPVCAFESVPHVLCGRDCAVCKLGWDISAETMQY
jgi:hypothetical protein